MLQLEALHSKLKVTFEVYKFYCHNNIFRHLSVPDVRGCGVLKFELSVTNFTTQINRHAKFPTRQLSFNTLNFHMYRKIHSIYNLLFDAGASHICSSTIWQGLGVGKGPFLHMKRMFAVIVCNITCFLHFLIQCSSKDWMCVGWL